MQTTRLKLVTIIMEAVLEDQLIEAIKDLGATGYTMVEVKGEGSRGVGASDFEGRNLRLETLVSPRVEERIMTHLAEEYFPLYAVVAYSADVDVVRGEKYVRDESQGG